MISQSIAVLSRAAYWFAGVLLIALILLTCYEVLARYALRAPTIWGLEVAEWLNAALFLLAGPLVLRMQGHIVIDVLSVRMPRRVSSAILGVFYVLLLMPSVGLIAYYAAKESWRSWLSDARSLSAWQAPLWPIQFLVFIGLGLLVLQIAVEAMRLFSHAESKD